MPKWLIGVVLAITTFVVLVVFATMRTMGGASEDPKAVTASDAGTVTVVESGVNAATFTTDPSTGEKVFTPRPGIEQFAVPTFALVNQNGDATDQSVLEGEITVVSFLFTHCQTACPPITASMRRMYSELEGTDVRFLSMSVDPVHDTPERLTEYAGNLLVDTDRWVFLTGEPGETARVVNESLKFDISEDSDEANIIELPDGSTMSNILHPTKIFLVGPDRQILDFCTPTVETDWQRFADLARRAAG